METLTIEVPESLKQFVHERVAEDGYKGAGEYVRELILADRKRKDAERLDHLLIEGLESGESVEVTEEFWEDLERGLVERHEKAVDHS